MLYATMLKLVRLMIEEENCKKQDCLEINKAILYIYAKYYVIMYDIVTNITQYTLLSSKIVYCVMSRDNFT